MAAPMTPDQLMQVLKAEGLKVVGVREWKTHNRAGHGNWGPINGVMIHHTVTSGTQNSIDICYNGYSSLPGPLCHGVVDKDGTVYLVSAGRANHAGLGDDDVLTAVKNEAALPADNEANTDGNAHFYGFECVNLGDGRDPWPELQLIAIEKIGAAICRHYGWTYRSVIGHKEWQPGKIDPNGFTMDYMRGRIQKRLAGEPVPHTPPTPPEDNVSLTTEQASQLNTLYNLRNKGPWMYKGAGTADAWAILNGLTTQVVALTATVAALTKIVADAADDVNTETVVAAVDEAIKTAVIQVHVDVAHEEGPTP